MNPILLSTFKATALPSLAAATLPDRSKNFATLERKTAISICCYKIKQNKCRRNDQVNHAKDHGHKYVRNKSCQASHAMSSKVHANQVVPCHVHHANHVTHVMSKHVHVTPNMYMPCHAMAIMSRKIAKYIIFGKKNINTCWKYAL